MERQLTRAAAFLIFFSFCKSTSINLSPHCLWPTSCEFCERGWYGTNCESKCINCDIGGCDKEYGICLLCTAGYYTTECTTPCPPHCRESYDGKIYCDRETGKCLENCKKGWWGDWCEKQCSFKCLDKDCIHYDGSCYRGCISGWSGGNCDEPCPNNCRLDDYLTETCHQRTKDCLVGCKDGWWGNQCDVRCSRNCVNNKCNHNYGTCTEGCKNGWRGDKCHVLCPTGCRYGICYQHNGTCTGGCNQGVYGAHCDKVCTGHCADSDCSLNVDDISIVCNGGCVDGWWSYDCRKKCPKDCTSCEQKSGYCPLDVPGTTAPTTNDSNKLIISCGLILAVLFIRPVAFG